MRRVLIVIAAALAVAGGAQLGRILRGHVEPSSSPAPSGVTLDRWQELAQAYHRALPTGKDVILLRLPNDALRMSLTTSVTVNGESPAGCAGSGPCGQ